MTSIDGPPPTHLDELIQKQAELVGFVGGWEIFVKAQKTSGRAKRSLGGSERIILVTFEEEMSNLSAWIDQMGVETTRHGYRRSHSLQPWIWVLKNHKCGSRTTNGRHTQPAYKGGTAAPTTLGADSPTTPEAPLAFDGKPPVSPRRRP